MINHHCCGGRLVIVLWCRSLACCRSDFQVLKDVFVCCSVYAIDLGSVHGTFVANERLSKDSPVELEVGQSLRFAASTRSYVLRKIVQGTPVAPAELPANFVYPPAPDASDEEAIVTYNTALNKLGVPSPGAVPTTTYHSRYCLLFE